MRILRNLILTGAMALGTIMAVSAQSTPQLVKVQGFLSDKSGGPPVPANGIFNMIFDLYDAETMGSLVNSAGPIPVGVTNGLYEAMVPFPASAFKGTARWVEITVDTETLAPRVQIGSVPFAYMADTVDGFEGADLEESAEIFDAVSIHSAGPDAHREHASLEESTEILDAVTLHSAGGDPHGQYLQQAGDLVTGTLTFDATPDPMMFIFDTCCSSPERALFAHSPGVENWGLFYRDSDDEMIFKSGGSEVMSVDLGARQVKITGGLTIDGVSMTDTTRFFSIPGNAFDPAVETVDVFRSFTGYLYSPSGGTSRFFAPVHLPHGATVTTVVADLYDANATYSPILSLIRTNAGLRYVLASVSTIADTGFQPVSDSIISWPVIDNTTYQYFLELILVGTAGSTNRLYGVEIQYTVDNPLP